MTPLFELRELACRRGSIDALRGVSLSFPPGELTGLIGLNGAARRAIIQLTVEWFDRHSADRSVAPVRDRRTRRGTSRRANR